MLGMFDAEAAVARAVLFADFGEQVEHRICEWHLERKLRYHLPEALLADRGHPLTRALDGAFKNGRCQRMLACALK